MVMAKQAGRKLVIDTSGPLLKAAYKQVCISPSLREFKILMGESLESIELPPYGCLSNAVAPSSAGSGRAMT